MNEEANSQLDHVLQQWAREHEPGNDRLARLRAAILDHTHIPIATPAAAQHWWQSVAGRAMAAALSALAVLAVAMLLQRPTPVTVASPDSSVPQAHLQSLLAEMERVFDHRLTWVAETNREVLLGIEGNGAPSSAPHVAVRVVVLQRSSSSDNWRTLWRGDVATRSEELVRVASPQDGSRLNLWTHILPDGAVTIDSELAITEGSQTWKTSSVQQPQVPQQVLATRQGDSEYQVWQTAIVLSEDAL